MHRLTILCAAFAAALCASLPARAEGERAGDFDYYVLALSWTPSWCAHEGDARDAEQCAPEQGHGFTLHGLWPQYEAGWPSFCRTAERDPTRRQTGAMADIMGSGGLAWYQWKKHGRCSGLDPDAYFDAARRAYDGIARPEVLRALPRAMDIPPEVVEAAFLEANPALKPDGITITCRAGRLQEAQICLTRDLQPRTCGEDVRRDCGARTVLVPPIR
ncbi:ribonuclease T2 family protein [Oceanibium sediminis]|uniref:ribonuclease T2 family protein n=1 Tax=Oceanibium sediminis TaxID=2026339 RepID=UPI000DD452C6|nr:ribonuclease T2 [Oceanibium sediminis]